MTADTLQDILQSAYKPAHSTDTAFLHVNNDILSASDKQIMYLLGIN